MLTRVGWNPSRLAPRAVDLQHECPLPELPQVSETERRLLDAVLANPDADEPRSAYLAWKEKQGDCHTLPDFACFGATEVLVRRGFVEGLSLTSRAFISLGDRLMHLTPLREVRLVAVQPFLDELARCPHLAKLRRLDLTGNHIGPDGLKRLAISPFLTNLRELGLNGNSLGSEGLKEILSATWFRNLSTLEIADNGLGDADFAVLPPLTMLDFSGNSVESIEKLPPGLKHVKLTHCGLSHFSVRGSESLQVIDLGNNRLGPIGVTGLAMHASSARLRSIDLRFNEIEDDGVRALCGLPSILESLNLRGNRITEEGVRAMSETDAFASVVDFDLGTNPIGDAGAVALLQGESLASLKRLALSNCGISDAGAQALVATGALGGLRELSLAWNTIGDTGVIALASCPDLAGLRHLDLTGTHIGFAGAIALAKSRHFLSLRSVTLDENERLPADGLAFIRERFGTLTGAESRSPLPGS